MALEQSIVFRQIEQGSRFSRFDILDGSIVLILTNLHYLIEIFIGGNYYRAWITLVAAAVGVYFLRTRFPEGVAPLLHVITTPRHLSSFGKDVFLKPYPPGIERKRNAT